MKMIIILAIAPIVSILLLLVIVESTRLYVVEEWLMHDHRSGGARPVWLTNTVWRM